MYLSHPEGDGHAGAEVDVSTISAVPSSDDMLGDHALSIGSPGKAHIRRPLEWRSKALARELAANSPFTSSVFSNISAISNSCGTAWGGAHSSSSFSPSPNNAHLPNGPPPATSSQAASFPLGPSTPTPRQDHKVILQNLASLTVCVPYHSLAYRCPSGAYVTCSKGDDGHLITKTSKRYEGVIASTTESEGVTTGVTLRDVKELGAPNAPIKSPLFIASTNNESCLHTHATLLSSFNWRLCKCPCYHPDHLTPLFS